MIVAKFGGTSVSTAPNIKTIGEITRRVIKKQPVIVVSAVSGVTDLLLSLTKQTNHTGIIRQIERQHRELAQDFWDKDVPEEVSRYITQTLDTITKVVNKKKNTKRMADELVSYGEQLSSFIVSRALESLGIPTKQIVATAIIVTTDEFGSADF